MTNPGIHEPIHEASLSPEVPGHFRFGEVIAVPQGMPGEEDLFPPAKLIVVGHNYMEGASPDTVLAYAYLNDKEVPETGPLGTQWLHFNKKFLAPPYSTGQSFSLGQLVAMEVNRETQEANVDLRTYPWTSSTAQSLVTLVEQNIADKVTRGEVVSDNEQAINQARRDRLANPEGSELLWEAFDNGTIDLTPYIEAVEASR